MTKTLYVDWRRGAPKVFFDLLVDGDVANNVGNWQWVAGTGVDTRPNRLFNPIVRRDGSTRPSAPATKRSLPSPVATR